MRLDIFKTLWGHQGSYAEAAAQAHEAGFAGLEATLPAEPAKQRELAASLRDAGLDYIGEVYTGGWYVPDRRAPPERHLADIAAALAAADELAPRFVTAIAGCDAWPLDTSLCFFEDALRLAEKSGHALVFETHRSRTLFNPWVAVEVLRRLPELRLTADFSHWFVVCERALDDEPDAMDFIASRVHHIHARVGYDQGPQVPHPAAPEYARWLEAHQRLWQSIWQSQRSRGYATTTLTPEFGPDGYLHEHPYTREPVADLWEINRWMGNTEREHFARWQGA
ncbi:TIM barrel protein [Sulfurisoma sediminicola]|uniref:Sugar phosphate isomerase/epimerase n=1 Tax=Sulfurisoma sediminicola TaxID=1381557 RepID=A0A497XE33_9PROT|nr:TIM barrel protein [Sulfurisoma sediminicola]RLJ64926.1 sugar phosphate isomerase/epimerase [Sulfurisoma sediminicola]